MGVCVCTDTAHTPRAASNTRVKLRACVCPCSGVMSERERGESVCFWLCHNTPWLSPLSPLSSLLSMRAHPHTVCLCLCACMHACTLCSLSCCELHTVSRDQMGQLRALRPCVHVCACCLTSLMHAAHTRWLGEWETRACLHTTHEAHDTNEHSCTECQHALMHTTQHTHRSTS